MTAMPQRQSKKLGGFSKPIFPLTFSSQHPAKWNLPNLTNVSTTVPPDVYASATQLSESLLNAILSPNNAWIK